MAFRAPFVLLQTGLRPPAASTARIDAGRAELRLFRIFARRKRVDLSALLHAQPCRAYCNRTPCTSTFEQ